MNRYLLTVWTATAAAGFLAAASAYAGDVPVGGTDVSGTVFVDVSHIDQHGAGAGRNDTEADLKRFYINIGHRFSDAWSAHLTTDIQWKRHDDPTDLRVKKAYLEGKFSPALTLRLGVNSMPWMSLVNRWYGFRYVETGLVRRARTGHSADWGVHVSGLLGQARRVGYAVSVVTGAGYKKPRLGNGPDVAVRVSWQPGAHWIMALGGYRGTLAQNVDGRRRQHRARRWDAMLAWADSRWRLGGQYFHAEDWDRVLDSQGDNSHGWSVWASMQITPRVAVFARHDHITPSASLDPERHDRYSNAGVQWRARPWLRLAAVYKRQRLVLAGQARRTVNEAGLWAQITF